MYSYKFDNVTVTSDVEMDSSEYQAYIERGRKDENPRNKLISIDAKQDSDDEYINLMYNYDSPKFNRIRRITGYLSMDISLWNNAKLAELNDRVKHDVSESSSLLSSIG